VLICPAGIDVAEGAHRVLIGSNITITDTEPVPGQSDAATDVQVEISVAGGGLHLLPEALQASDDRAHLANLSGIPATLFSPDAWQLLGDENAEVAGGMAPHNFRSQLGLGLVSTPSTVLPRGETVVTAEGPTIKSSPVPGSSPQLPSGAFIPALRFNATLGGLRAVLRALAFSPYPEYYTGIVHFFFKVTAVSTGEETSCDVGIVVHPSDPPPATGVDDVPGQDRKDLRPF